MIWYAWAQEGQEPRFIGPANPRTGKRSQAGSLAAFTNPLRRDAFVAQTRGTAVAVSARRAREIKAGLSDRSFNELVRVLTGGEE
ncbi:hypothetical protein CF130_05040 [Aeromonas dhakensis]|nr:hypothetical protein CF130_05040 [Aeromonas dhakensis]